MNQQQPQLYNSLTSALGPEEQQVIKAVLEQAEKIATEQAQQQQQQGGAAAPAVAGVQPPNTNGTS